MNRITLENFDNWALLQAKTRPIQMGAVALSRQQLASLFRPLGPKYVTTVSFPTPTVGAGSGGTATVTQQVDLTLPIRGFRVVIKGRVAVGTANYTTVNPESILNLLGTIQITGTNRRQNGNVTLWFIDLATLWTANMLLSTQGPQIQINGAQAQRPSSPFGFFSQAGANIIPLTTGASPYDFVITLDLPAAPFNLSGLTGPLEMGYLIRQQEWKDSLTFKFVTPTVLDNAANPLGTSAATTVTAITAFGSGAGSPTIDIYSLPCIMGDTQNLIVPGVISRNIQPINTALLTATGTNVELMRLQKQLSSRIFLKIGAGTAFPVFTSLLDTEVTSFGMQIGTDRNVRDLLDWFAHRQEMVDHYNCPGIQGYNLFDFIQGGNPDSSYPGDQLGDGAVMRLIANVTGTANGQGLVLQEQILQAPAGLLVGGSGGKGSAASS
jgi:hypothetical protein